MRISDWSSDVCSSDLFCTIIVIYIVAQLVIDVCPGTVVKRVHGAKTIDEHSPQMLCVIHKQYFQAFPGSAQSKGYTTRRSEIGRASGGEEVDHYVKHWGMAENIKKK